MPPSAGLPLFDFSLTPISDIEPWIENGRRTLHWFALSHGQYWINAGSARIFEPREGSADPAIWQYYLARFWSDVLEMLPAALEPIPEDIARRLRPDRDFVRWELTANAWLKNRGEATEVADFDLLQAALSWANERQLNTGYWIGGPKVWFARTGETISISWDNRSLVSDGQPLWTAEIGAFEISAEHFRREVRDFHQRLMGAMKQRLELLVQGPRASKLLVAPEQISTEQIMRNAALDQAFEGVKLRVPTDWAPVRCALASLEAEFER